MPRCNTCNRVYPPDFVDIDNEELKTYKCNFCRDNKEYIVIGEGANEVVYRKEEVIFDYEKFLERLKSNENLRKAHQEKMINDMIAKDKEAGLI